MSLFSSVCGPLIARRDRRRRRADALARARRFVTATDAREVHGGMGGVVSERPGGLVVRVVFADGATRPSPSVLVLVPDEGDVRALTEREVDEWDTGIWQ